MIQYVNKIRKYKENRKNLEKLLLHVNEKLKSFSYSYNLIYGRKYGERI